jgi:hypothetical protein
MCRPPAKVGEYSALGQKEGPWAIVSESSGERAGLGRSPAGRGMAKRPQLNANLNSDSIYHLRRIGYLLGVSDKSDSPRSVCPPQIGAIVLRAAELGCAPA